MTRDAAPGAWLPGGTAAIRIRLLGRFAVQRGPEEIPLRAFGGRRAQQLLRLLALRRGALVPKDIIAEALWPLRPPGDAAGNIEVLVSRIRRALGDRTLVRTGPGGYALTGDGRCWVDAEAFVAAVEGGRTRLADQPREALASFREALDIWHGEPLAEDTYAEWAQDDRRHLALAFLEALEGAATAALVTGDPAEAITLGRAGAGPGAAARILGDARRAGARRGRRPGRGTGRVRLVPAPAGKRGGLAPSAAAQELRQRILRGEPFPAGPGPGPAAAVSARRCLSPSPAGTTSARRSWRRPPAKGPA